MTTEGMYHDLEDLLGTCLRHPVLSLATGKVTIRWSGHRTRYGCYTWRTGVIEISKYLDTPRVPRYFLLSVIGHEILHHLIPWEIDQDWHGPTFRAAEKALPWTARADRFAHRYL